MADFPTELSIPIKSGTTPRRSLARMLVCCLLLVAASSCKPKDPQAEYGASPSPGKKDDREQVAILADSLAMPLRNYQCALLERLILTRPAMAVTRYSAGGDAARQAAQVRTAQAAGASFIVVFPQEASIIAPALREAMGKGVHVISLSADLPEDAFTVSISCDERRLGAMAARFIIQALTTKAADEGLPAPTGRVVQLRGDDESSTASERAEGFMEALMEEPGVVLVHDAPAEWNDANASARIQEALRLQKKFDVVYAHNDLMAAGAAKHLRDTSVEVRESMLIVGTDAVPGNEGGASLVNKGVLDATLYHPPLVDVAWREIERMIEDPGHAPKRRQQVRPVLITPSNATDFARQSLPLPQLE